MNRKIENILITAFFCGFLAIMLLCYLFLPKQSFSQREKRYLAQKPVLTLESLLSGELGEQIEEYLSDHIPGRTFYVGLNAYSELVTGRQAAADVRLLEGNRIVEAPVAWNQPIVEKSMNAINSFAELVGRRVDLMIVPSAGWASDSGRIRGLDLFSHEEYSDKAFIAEIYAMASGEITTFDAVSVMENREDCYYRTDHHWNSRGAWEVYRSYMNSLGRSYFSEDMFRIESVPGFLGSTYTRSGLWAVDGETLELWYSGTFLSVQNAETEEIHEGVFYRNRLDEADKYTVYLDGNHSVVRIDNPTRKGEGKILVIRDSYVNCLGCFLAESYESVVLVDLRYYKKPVSELCAQENFDDILICYSIGNFMTDTNLVWLR